MQKDKENNLGRVSVDIKCKLGKAFNLDEALAGHFVKVKGTDDPKRIVGQSAFRITEYILEDEYGAYRLSLDRLQEGFYMYEGNENEKKQENQLTRQDLIVGHVYEAKKKQINLSEKLTTVKFYGLGRNFIKVNIKKSFNMIAQQSKMANIIQK